MKWPLRNIYISNRLFWLIGIVALLFAVSFSIGALVVAAQTLIILIVVVIATDLILLFNRSMRITVERKSGKLFSLSDENMMHLIIESKCKIPLDLNIIDELPYQLQIRDFAINLKITPGQKLQVDYPVRPYVRGAYTFSNVNIYASSIIGIISRRFTIDCKTTIPVYPSLIQMKEYELKTMSRISFFDGVKKLRRIGHSYEFEQIKKYVRGDDVRSINWKATGRMGEIMVNHYEDEKSQQVFCIIDKSRTMKMPFNNLSLMDYAINSTLTISNIALKKEDRVGLISFSDKIGTTLGPDKHNVQLRKIMEALYNEKERFNEANYELLYLHIRNYIKVRSLIFLFTNFESLYAIERAVSILRKLNKLHLLVVIFFENEEITAYAKTDAPDLEGIYLKTIAEKFAVEKNLIRQELIKYGIQTIISKPEDLSINTINKYLELKSRGLI